MPKKKVATTFVKVADRKMGYQDNLRRPHIPAMGKPAPFTSLTKYITEGQEENPERSSLDLLRFYQEEVCKHSFSALVTSGHYQSTFQYAYCGYCGMVERRGRR
jgi:hypothetical protein